VSGFAAKPVVVILLMVEDSAEETFYGPALKEAGYVLRVREPERHRPSCCRPILTKSPVLESPFHGTGISS
jgi:hypothetical protein